MGVPSGTTKDHPAVTTATPWVKNATAWPDMAIGCQLRAKMAKLVGTRHSCELRHRAPAGGITGYLGEFVTHPQAVWSLSGFGDEVDPDPSVQAAVLLALGAGHIEVRSAWGTNVSELEPDAVHR